MPTVFTKIIQRELPAYIVAEDVAHIAFLDVRPLKKGHTLVVPKKEIDNLWNLPTIEFEGLMTFTKKIATAIQQVISCKRTGMAVVGLEVPHAHIHLIPINEVKDMDFNNSPVQVSDQEMNGIMEKIKRGMNFK